MTLRVDWYAILAGGAGCLTGHADEQRAAL
jgi:hypothetical protein